MSAICYQSVWNRKNIGIDFSLACTAYLNQAGNAGRHSALQYAVMNFLQFVHFINAEITHQVGFELHALDRDREAAAEASGLAKLHIASGYQIDVLHNTLDTALLHANIAVIQTVDLSLAATAGFFKQIAMLNDRPISARIAFHVETGTLALLQSFNIGALSRATLANDFSTFVGAITTTTLDLDLVVAETRAKGNLVRLVLPPHFSTPVAALAALAAARSASTCGPLRDERRYDFARVLEALPSLWGGNAARAPGPATAVMRIDETFASYRAPDNVDLYFQKIALPNNEEAIAVTVQLAQFHHVPGASAALIASLRALTNLLPRGFLFFSDVRQQVGTGKADVTDVSLSGVIVLNQPGRRLAAEFIDLKEAANFMAAALNVLGFMYEPGAEMYFAWQKPDVTPSGYILPGCVERKEERAKIAFGQAVYLQHLPLNDHHFIAFADMLGKSFAPPSTRFRLRSERLPELNLTSLKNEESISFSAFDKTEIRLTRMLGKDEQICVYASACQISCGGALPNGEPLFWKSLSKVTAPVEIIADNGGNVVMMQTLPLAGMTKEKMGEEATHFWKQVQYVRNYCDELERNAGKKGAFKMTVHNKHYHPMPSHFIARVRNDRSALLHSFISAASEEMQNRTGLLPSTPSEEERLSA